MEEFFNALSHALGVEDETNYNDFLQVWLDDDEGITDETVFMIHFFKNIFGFKGAVDDVITKLGQ